MCLFQILKPAEKKKPNSSRPVTPPRNMVPKPAKKWGSREPAGLVSYARIRSRPLRLYFPPLPCFPHLPSRAAAGVLEGSLLISQTAFIPTSWRAASPRIEIQEDFSIDTFKMICAPANHWTNSLFLCTWSFFVFVPWALTSVRFYHLGQMLCECVWTQTSSLFVFFFLGSGMLICRSLRRMFLLHALVFEE